MNRVGGLPVDQQLTGTFVGFMVPLRYLQILKTLHNFEFELLNSFLKVLY